MTKKPTPALSTLPFSEQFRLHMAQSAMRKTVFNFGELAASLNLPGIDADALEKIMTGKMPPTVRLANELCRALNLQDPEESKANEYGISPNLVGMLLIASARKEQSVYAQASEFGAKHGATTNEALGRLFGVDGNVLSKLHKNGEFSHYTFAKKFADKMELRGQARNDFFAKGGWYADNAQTIEALQNKQCSLGKAIKCLCPINGWEQGHMADKLKVPRSTFNSWTSKDIIPPREIMFKMSKEKYFALTKDQEKIFLEAAQWYVDKAHVVEALRADRITIKAAVDRLIEIVAGSSIKYAGKIKLEPNTLRARITSGISRKDLLRLVKDLPMEDQRFVMEKARHYRDPQHIKDKMKDEKDQSLFILAFKDLYDLTDDDFSLGGNAVRDHRNHGITPKIESAVKEFVAVEKAHADVKICWDAYKHVCARFAGHEDGTHASALFMRQMEEEHRRQMRRR